MNDAEMRETISVSHQIWIFTFRMHQGLNLCHPCICCHGVVVGLSPILISGTNITDDNLTRAPLIHGSARILFNQLQCAPKSLLIRDGLLNTVLCPLVVDN